MATTANHPDGGFVGPAEPDEDIAAIAKQISDHAEVIYQTWKARGLAPNEILTCHNNINVADKFGSVLTSSFSSQNLNNSDSKSNVPPMMEFLYRNPARSANSANNLEQIVNKFVVEDKARLAVRQKNDASGVPSTAKNYPSSIQYALQKFEKKSPADVANSAAKFSSRSDKSSDLLSPTTTKTFPVKSSKSQFASTEVIVAKNHPEQFIPVSNAPRMIEPDEIDNRFGETLTTKPLKTKTISDLVTKKNDTKANGGTHYIQKRSTLLPSKLEKKSSSDEFLDEVAKEEERLINALKTGVVITATDSKGVLNGSDDAATSEEVNEEDTKMSNNKFSNKTKTKQTTSAAANEKVHQENLKKFSVPNTDTVAVGSGGISAKRNRRKSPSPDFANSEISVGNPPQRSNLRPNTLANNFNNQPNPVRPFLTRGSVAERVLMFEKCPTEIIEKRTKLNNANAAASWKNLASDVYIKIQNYSKDDYQRKGVYPPHTTLQRHTKANKNVFIPRFYYPNGKPISQHQQNIIFKNIEDVFRSLPNMHVTKEQFSSVTKACGCPLYWKAALFIACGGEKLGFIEMSTFLEYWKELTSVCHDDASKFIRIVTRSSNKSYIIPEDLIPLVQDVVNTHPGLTFLKQAPEFHSRYVHTVICRVYYSVNQSWNGQISLAELRKCDFLRAIQLLEEEEDINQVTAYFSYEHFYVIYCKFWELDKDHDLFISKEDLARHSDHALSTRIIDRIFSRTRSKSRNSMLQEGKMSYTDFVIFLLAEEDKRHPRAIEYWFRCMDLDGDGFLSMYELEYFYDEQLQRMEAMGIECLPFEDCLCQMLDMIQPKISDKISLSDLKRCKMTSIFFDTFFNLEKYLDHEQRDPFATQRDHENEMSDWDKYAAEQYEMLVAEESGTDHYEEIGQYSITEPNDDEDDLFSSNLDDILNGSREFVNNNMYKKQNNNYLAENFLQPSMLVTEYSDNQCNSDSSDDYAGDSDDCSL